MGVGEVQRAMGRDQMLGITLSGWKEQSGPMKHPGKERNGVRQTRRCSAVETGLGDAGKTQWSVELNLGARLRRGGMGVCPMGSRKLTVGSSPMPFTRTAPAEGRRAKPIRLLAQQWMEERKSVSGIEDNFFDNWKEKTGERLGDS